MGAIRESAFQAKVIQWLKEQGCYVIKNTANPGVPLGCPDVVFFKGKFYGFLEVKPSRSARFRPLQKETVAKLDDWGWAKVVYPENFESIKEELAPLLVH